MQSDIGMIKRYLQRYSSVRTGSTTEECLASTAQDIVDNLVVTNSAERQAKKLAAGVLMDLGVL